MIISASRRTDIPAFHAEWMMERLREGFVCVRNPFNVRQVSRVSLKREETEGIVFWTKDASNLLPCLDEIDGMGHRILFQYTLTPYGTDIEPQVDKARAAGSLMKLAARYGKEKIIWRYDPILLTEGWTPEKHVKMFERMCRRLEGASGRCVISFVDLYASLKRKAAWIQSPTEGEMHEMAREIARIAREHGFLPSACAEQLDFGADGLAARGCIAREDIEAAWGIAVSAAKDTGQRSACRCVKSVDIGAYDTCAHGCVYCYARKGRIKPCNVHSPILGGELTGEEQISERRENVQRQAQISIFD